MGKWIEWRGGECPVTDGTAVEIGARNGGVWSTNKASDYYWGDDGSSCDIVRYRVVDDEADRDPDTPVKTLRDEIAIAALTGIVGGYWGTEQLSGLGPNEFADEAYQIADAMLAARKESE